MKYILVVSIFLVVGCSHTERPNREQLIIEIIDAEKQFNDMAAEKGIGEAFIFFADENAAILRGKEITIGKKAITQQLEKSANGKSSLTWKPDFIDVAASGDLGYTYGKYIYTSILETGDTITDEGYFHTVWKKQPDGSWKYVWD